jgi:hypothetical protein
MRTDTGHSAEHKKKEKREREHMYVIRPSNRPASLVVTIDSTYGPAPAQSDAKSPGSSRPHPADDGEARRHLRPVQLQPPGREKPISGYLAGSYISTKFPTVRSWRLE